MTTTATAPKTKPLNDDEVSGTLSRIRKAIDRVASQLDLPESAAVDHQLGGTSAERSVWQAEGGLLRNALQRGTMLITKESSTRMAAERKSATDDLSGHVGAVLRELNTVRTETKRLLDQRRQLEVYLTALKGELECLRAEKLELMALKVQVTPHLANGDVDLVARARAAVGPRQKSDASAEAATTDAPDGFSPRGQQDEDAFEAFLEADVDHDKSREWFMAG